MHILITGVSGFIGQNLYRVLSHDGHKVTGCSRKEVAGINWKPFDFNTSLEELGINLQDFDLVINTIGIYQQSPTQGFTEIHDLGPKRLFDACRVHKVRVMQISAIGADQDHPVTDFLKSKRNADQYLLNGSLPNIVLYPGIVLGQAGRTTRQLSLIARLPCIPLVFGRNIKLPLISIDQLTEYVLSIINNWPETKQAKVLVAKPETMEHLLNMLRLWMGLGKGCFISVPNYLVKLGFYLLPKLSIGAFNKQSIELLSAYSKTTTLPISNQTASDSLLRNKATEDYLKDLRIKTLFYINLIALGLIWIISGLSSLINFDQSRELISLIGINGILGDTIISTAAIADILLGIFLWVPRIRRWVIYIQISVMLVYSIIITAFIPIFWLHPFAPIIKNLAMIVLALYLLVEEKE